MLMQQKPEAHENGMMPAGAPYNNYNLSICGMYVSAHPIWKSNRERYSEQTPCTNATPHQHILETSRLPLYASSNRNDRDDCDSGDRTPYSLDDTHQRNIRTLRWSVLHGVSDARKYCRDNHDYEIATTWPSSQ